MSIPKFVVLSLFDRSESFVMHCKATYRNHVNASLTLLSPIFTYRSQGTNKPGVVASEHAIAYSHGHKPTLMPGEQALEKDPICIMSADGQSLNPASRIYFGIHHPIQYNVKVKDLGNVVKDHIHRLIGYWMMESDNGGGRTIISQDSYAETEVPKQTQDSGLEHQEHEETTSGNRESSFEPNVSLLIRHRF